MSGRRFGLSIGFLFVFAATGRSSSFASAEGCARKNGSRTISLIIYPHSPGTLPGYAVVSRVPWPCRVCSSTGSRSFAGMVISSFQDNQSEKVYHTNQWPVHLQACRI